MTSQAKKKLLKNKRVVEEINRHRWIESEKSGHDIGFERASADWLEKFSKAWMSYHMPKRKVSSRTRSKTTSKRRTPSRKSSPKSKRS